MDESDRKADSASALSALDITDSRAFLSGVSDAEQACLSGEIDPGRLMLLVGTPELTKEEERAILIGCLEHETLLRLVLTPVLDQAGPLSVESSACIRDAFADADLVALMTAAVAGSDEDSEAAMVGAMTGLFATLSCLSTDEFQAAGPALGMDPDDSQGFKCVFDALGGPEELTALMQPDAGPPLTVFSAAMACNLETQKARLYCTGSMSPTLTCLDMPTVAREFGPADILADSIIAFRAPDCFESDYYDDVPIMHRVTEVLDGPDGLPMYTTAGDARGEADPCPVPYENVVGLVIGITYDAYPGNAGMYNETQAAAGAFWAASDVYDEAVTDYEVALSNYEVALSVYEVALSDYENVVARYDQRYEELCGFPVDSENTCYLADDLQQEMEVLWDGTETLWVEVEAQWIEAKAQWVEAEALFAVTERHYAVYLQSSCQYQTRLHFVRTGEAVKVSCSQPANELTSEAVQVQPLTVILP